MEIKEESHTLTKEGDGMEIKEESHTLTKEGRMELVHPIRRIYYSNENSFPAPIIMGIY